MTFLEQLNRQYPDRVEFNYEDDEFIIHYVVDPAIKPLHWDYILHHGGKVELNSHVKPDSSVRALLHSLIMDQIPYDELNPPLVVYVHVSSGKLS